MQLAAARRRRTSAGIFTASMADVVLLLIVFFVLDALKQANARQAFLLSEQEVAE